VVDLAVNLAGVAGPAGSSLHGICFFLKTAAGFGRIYRVAFRHPAG